MNNDIIFLSFDLGSNVGISLNRYNIEKKKFSIISTDTISLKPCHHFTPNIINLVSSKCLNTILFEEYIIEYVSNILLEYKLDACVVEDIFFNPRLIQAYSSLLLYLIRLEEIFATRFDMRIWKIPPRLVKKVFSKDGTSKKDGMRKIVENNSRGWGLTKDQIQKMSSHEIDAIAVGYSFIELYIG